MVLRLVPFFSGFRKFMNDRRVCAIRDALEAFVESVDATSRIARWGADDPVPESLRDAAAQLKARQKAANDLTVDKASGAPAIVHRLATSSRAIRQLSTACDEFLNCSLDPKNDIATALENLDAAIDSVHETLRSLD